MSNSTHSKRKTSALSLLSFKAYLILALFFAGQGTLAAQSQVALNECGRLLLNLVHDADARIGYTQNGRSFKIVSEVAGGRHFPAHFINPRISEITGSIWIASYGSENHLATARIVVDRFQIWRPEDSESSSFLRLDFRIEQSDPRLSRLSTDTPDTFGISEPSRKKDLGQNQDIFLELPFSSKAQIHLLKSGQLLVAEEGQLFLSSDLSLLAVRSSLLKIQSLMGIAPVATVDPSQLQLEQLMSDVATFEVIQDESNSTPRNQVFVRVNRKYSTTNSRDWPVVLRFSSGRRQSGLPWDLQLGGRSKVQVVVSERVLNTNVVTFEPQRRGEMLIQYADHQPQIGLDIYRQKAPHPLMTPKPTLIERLRGQFPLFAQKNPLGIEFSGFHILSSDVPWSYQLKTQVIEISESDLFSKVKSFASVDGHIHTVLIQQPDHLELVTRPKMNWQTGSSSLLTTLIPLSRQDLNHKGKETEVPLQRSVLILQRMIVSAYYKENELFHIMTIHDLQTGEDFVFRISNRTDSVHHPLAFLDFVVTLSEMTDPIQIRYQQLPKSTSFREPDLSRNQRESAEFYSRVRALYLAMRQMPQARHNELLTELYLRP